MTQLTLDLPPMHAMSLFCKLDGKLSRWDTHCADPAAAIAECQAVVRQDFRGKHGTVMGLIRNAPILSVDNTPTNQ